MRRSWILTTILLAALSSAAIASNNHPIEALLISDQYAPNKPWQERIITEIRYKTPVLVEVHGVRLTVLAADLGTSLAFDEMQNVQRYVSARVNEQNESSNSSTLFFYRAFPSLRFVSSRLAE